MEQKKSIIKKYKYMGTMKNFYYIRNVPPTVARKLMTGWPNVSPKDQQNYSPTMKEMVNIAAKNKGKLIGYVVPVESGREDARISFEGFILNIPELQALRLQEHLRADEFDKVRGGWRFWWD